MIQLKQIVRSYKNGIYKKSDCYGRGVPDIRMFNIKNGKVDTMGAPLLDVTEQELLDYELRPGDILINRVNSSDLVGKAGIVEEGIGIVVFDSMNIRLRIITEKCDPFFLSYFLNANLYYKQIHSLIKLAVAQSSLNQEDLDRVHLCLPPLAEQQKIISILRGIEEKLKYEENKKHLIDGLKKGLMQTLLTGKIRVKL